MVWLLFDSSVSEANALSRIPEYQELIKQDYYLLDTLSRLPACTTLPVQGRLSVMGL
jgi:hypothetical protein